MTQIASNTDGLADAGGTAEREQYGGRARIGHVYVDTDLGAALVWGGAEVGWLVWKTFSE